MFISELVDSEWDLENLILTCARQHLINSSESSGATGSAAGKNSGGDSSTQSNAFKKLVRTLRARLTVDPDLVEQSFAALAEGGNYSHQAHAVP